MGDRIQSRRPILKHISARDATNASLWFDKYIHHDVEADAEKPEKTLVNDVAGIPVSAEYTRFFERWKQLLEAKCPLPPKEATAQGRLAVGIGAESVLETSIALHRTYGVPYIPGSALKGLTAHYARNYLKEEWGEGTDTYRTLFGDTDTAGYITFFDALYVPDSGHNKQALWPDIITVHHKEYYQGKDKSPPADWDSPTPIHFLSATGRYLIALDGPNKEWVKTAFEVLGLSLAELGVGAKTSSGYGRLHLGGVKTSSVKRSSQKAPSASAPKPSREWNWQKGKTTKDGKMVVDASDPTKKFRFERGHVLPKGYTPARKADVEYAIETLPDGSQRVWVKMLYYPI